MSGGFFDYKQYHIEEITDDIERELNRQGKPKPKYELYNDDEFYKKYPEEKNHPIYTDVVREKMYEAVKQLKIAAIYVQRVDWLLSGDDNEANFIIRLEKELSELK